MTIALNTFNSKLDLQIERIVPVPPELVWEVLTKAEHLQKWFTPKPWTIPSCEVDLRVGGTVKVHMKGPNPGEENHLVFCILDIVPERRIVWTDALGAGFRPSANPFLTAITTMEPHPKGTRYVATAIHKDEATRNDHEKMGFHGGWGTVADQMIELVKTMK